MHAEVLGAHVDKKSRFEGVLHGPLCVLCLLRVQDSMLLEEVEAEDGAAIRAAPNVIPLHLQQVVELSKVVKAQFFARVGDRIDTVELFGEEHWGVRGQKCAPEDSVRHSVVALERVKDAV